MAIPTRHTFLRSRTNRYFQLDIAIADYEQHFREFQIPHSTALCSLMDEKPYLVGPLARVNLNWHLLNVLQILHNNGYC